MGKVQVKRIYEPVEETDGKRILVDRLWPRGLKKEAVQLDDWMKDIAPSTGLRKWFHQDTSNWQEFTARYILELKQNPAVSTLKQLLAQNPVVTLLYAAHDEQHNHALVLQQFISPVKGR
ncbi:DUF488 domain-containing protein [Mucilaginibacter sp. AW1-3]